MFPVEGTTKQMEAALSTMREISYVVYRQHFYGSIANDPIAQVSPSALTPTIIREWIGRHQWNPKTIRNKIGVLQLLCRTVGINKIDLPSLPAIGSPDRKILSIDDIREILEMPMPHMTRMAVGILATTGVRPQEVRALRAEHLKGRHLKIEASLADGLSGMIYDDPKSDRSFRTILMTDEYVLSHWPKSGFVLTSKKGQGLTMSTLNNWIKKLFSGKPQTTKQ